MRGRRRRIPLKVADPTAQAEEAARLAYFDQPLDEPARKWTAPEPQAAVASHGWADEHEELPPLAGDGWTQG